MVLLLAVPGELRPTAPPILRLRQDSATPTATDDGNGATSPTDGATETGTGGNDATGTNGATGTDNTGATETNGATGTGTDTGAATGTGTDTGAATGTETGGATNTDTGGVTQTPRQDTTTAANTQTDNQQTTADQQTTTAENTQQTTTNQDQQQTTTDGGTTTNGGTTTDGGTTTQGGTTTTGETTQQQTTTDQQTTTEQQTTTTQQPTTTTNSPTTTTQQDTTTTTGQTTTTAQQTTTSDTTATTRTDQTTTETTTRPDTSTDPNRTSSPPSGSSAPPTESGSFITSFSQTTIVTVVDGSSTTITSQTPISTTLSRDTKQDRQKRVGVIAGVTCGVVFLLILCLMVLFLYKRAKRERTTIIQLLRKRGREGKGAGSVGLLDSEFDDNPEPYRDNPGTRGHTPMSQMSSSVGHLASATPLAPSTQRNLPANVGGNKRFSVERGMKLTGIYHNAGSPSPSSHTRDGSALSMNSVLNAPLVRAASPSANAGAVHAKDLSGASGMGAAGLPTHTRRPSSPSGSPSPSLFRARASDTGSLFHEEGLRDDKVGFSDPLIHGPNAASSVDLGSIVDEVMGHSPSKHSDLADAALGPAVFGGAISSSPPLTKTPSPPLAMRNMGSGAIGRKRDSTMSTESSYSFIDAAEAPDELGRKTGKSRNNSLGAMSALSRYSDANSLYFDPFRSEYTAPGDLTASTISTSNLPHDSSADAAPDTPKSSNRSVYYGWKKGNKPEPGVGGYMREDTGDSGDSAIDPELVFLMSSSGSRGLPPGAAPPINTSPTRITAGSLTNSPISGPPSPSKPSLSSLPPAHPTLPAGPITPSALPATSSSPFGVYSALPGGKVASSVQSERGMPTSLLGLPAGGAGANPVSPKIAGGASSLQSSPSSSTTSLFDVRSLNAGVLASPGTGITAPSLTSLQAPPPVVTTQPMKSSPLSGMPMSMSPSDEGGGGDIVTMPTLAKGGEAVKKGHDKKPSLTNWLERKVKR